MEYDLGKLIEIGDTVKDIQTGNLARVVDKEGFTYTLLYKDGLQVPMVKFHEIVKVERKEGKNMSDEKTLTGDCDGSCSSCSNAKEEKLKEGDFVKILLTGAIGMIVDVYDYKKAGNYKKSYLVRLADYNFIKFYDFEIEKR